MNRVNDLLKVVPIFEELDDDAIRQIASLVTEKRFPKNTVLFREGDPGDELLIIKSGIVRIFRMEKSKEITLALFRDGDYLGEMSLLGDEPYRSTTAETLEDSVIYTLTRSDFTRFLEQYPSVCLQLLKLTISRLRRANDQIRDLTFFNVRSRIIKTILRLAEEHGIVRKYGTLIRIKLTHQQLANIVGTVRESVTKVLMELQTENVITITDKMILIPDLEELQKRIDT